MNRIEEYFHRVYTPWDTVPNRLQNTILSSLGLQGGDLVINILRSYNTTLGIILRWQI